MERDETGLVQVAHFRLEKIDNATGKVVEVIEGGDDCETIVTVFEEQDHGAD